jgi:hypothetical protein
VAADAGAGKERHVAEGLGLGGVDHLPDVDAQGVEADLQLVDQGDVDEPEDVLGQLDRLGGAGVADRHRGGDGVVERAGHAALGLAVGADDLGDRGGGEGEVAGILALGRIGQGEVAAGAQAASAPGSA